MQTGMPIEVPEKRPQLGKWARNVCPNLIGGKNLGAHVLQHADGPRVHSQLQHVHGHRQQGGGVHARQVLPRLRVQSRLRYGDNAISVFWTTVHKGRMDKGMPVWGGVLPDDTLWRIYAFPESVQTQP